MRTVLLLLALLAAPRAFADAAPPADAAAKSRIAAAAEVYKVMLVQVDTGIARPDEAYLWSTRWYAAEREAGVAAAAQSHLARMRALQTSIKSRVAAGMLRPVDAAAAAYYCAEAEVWAARK